MKIKIESSGGLTGISSSNQIETNKLPQSIEKTIANIMNNQNPSQETMKSAPPGSADYNTYKITIDDGRERRSIEVSQFNLEPGIKDLVKYVETNSKKEY